MAPPRSSNALRIALALVLAGAMAPWLAAGAPVPAPPRLVGASPGDAVNPRQALGLASDPGSTIRWRVSSAGAARDGVGPSLDLSGFADGPILIVADAQAGGDVSAQSTIPLSLDSVAPGAPRISSTPPSPARERRPSFGWVPAEAGGSFGWELRAAAGARALLTSGLSAGPPFRPPDVPDGSWTFRVRQIDGARNVGGWSGPASFVVDNAGPVATAAGAPRPGAPGPIAFPGRALLELAFDEPVRTVGRAPVQVCARRCGATVPLVARAQGSRVVVNPFPRRPRRALRSGVLYEIRVPGVRDLAGNAPTGAGATARWTFRVARDVLGPDPVTRLRARPVAAGVVLTWRLPTNEPVARIRILRRRDFAARGPGDRQAKVTLLRRPARRYVDRGAPAAGRYVYTVYAIDDAGNASVPALTSARVGDSSATANGVENRHFLNRIAVGPVGDVL